jgi:hypothetical protein
MLPHENARVFRLSDARAESIFSFLARLQIPNVFYNFIDLRIAEHRTERQHCARFTVLNAASNKGVVSFCVHELRSFARSAASIGMTPPTCSGERTPPAGCLLLVLMIRIRGVCSASRAAVALIIGQLLASATFLTTISENLQGRPR